MKFVITAAEEVGFVAHDPRTGTTTQGESIEQAITNLRGATSLYLEEFFVQVVKHPIVPKVK